MKTTRMSGIGLLLFVGVGCAAAVPPSDLVTARVTYARAAEGPATQFDPADLRTARESLDLAEQSFTKAGDTPETRNLAYVADRRAQIAEARGHALQFTAQQQQTLVNMHAAETTQVKTTTAQLGRAQQTIALQGQAILTEQQRRQDADKRAAQAAADLASFASVKQEVRGMVITVSGGVLFASGKSELLPGAQAKLNDVAEALNKQDPESTIVVEGHTDSQGGASYNQELSQRRAQTVRDYLVSRGIASSRVSAQGFGPTRAVGDNASPEGRANNRRVEIVVKQSAEVAPLSSTKNR